MDLGNDRGHSVGAVRLLPFAPPRGLGRTRTFARRLEVAAAPQFSNQEKYMRKLISHFCAAALVTASASATAQIFDVLRPKNEFKSQLYTFDVRGAVDAPVMRDMVHRALTEHGTNAFTRDNLVSGEPPRYPARMEFKDMSFMAVVVQIPTCAGSSFTVSSNDNSMASWGDSAQYMACGFRYAGGWRVNIYIGVQSTGGGIAGILSGKTLGQAISGAIGLASDPMQFMEASIDKLDSQFKAEGFDYALVEAVPNNAKRVVAADPLMNDKAAAERRAADRGKRMAARADLQKLGIDASDRARLIKAIQAGDEDVVALFVEAGALDMNQADAQGRRPVDYASKPAIRDLLRGI